LNIIFLLLCFLPFVKRAVGSNTLAVVVGIKPQSMHGRNWTLAVQYQAGKQYNLKIDSILMSEVIR
jgi:hypothetical protein